MNRDAALRDFRLGDFKLLLPLGKKVRVLIAGAGEQAFLPHLAGEVGAIDVLITADSAADQSAALAACGLSQARLITAAEGEYDLVFTDRLQDWPVRPGGVICRVYHGRAADDPAVTALIREGTWFAWPGWPEFRYLVPDTPAAWQAVEQDLMIYPPRSPQALLSRLAPGLATRTLPKRGLILYRRQGHGAHPSYPQRLAAAFAGHPELAFLTGLPWDRWLLYSGRLGEGNPILLFALDEQGHPQVLIKSARFPPLIHLRAETEQLTTIAARLGGELSRQVIMPLAAAEIDGRAALAYRFEPCFPFFGPRWRLAGRARFARRVTAWLAAVAVRTAHPLPESAFWEKHGAPLERLLSRGLLPQKLAVAAQEALAALRPLQAQPLAVLEHGDLGFYNTRLTDRYGRDFKVLDWGSSDLDGIPLGDLGYLLASISAPPRLGGQCLGAYLEATGYGRALALPLWLSYMARRWEELDAIRPPTPGDPWSGGAILLRPAEQVIRYIARL